MNSNNRTASSVPQWVRAAIQQQLATLAAGVEPNTVTEATQYHEHMQQFSNAIDWSKNKGLVAVSLDEDPTQPGGYRLSLFAAGGKAVTRAIVDVMKLELDSKDNEGMQQRASALGTELGMEDFLSALFANRNGDAHADRGEYRRNVEALNNGSVLVFGARAEGSDCQCSTCRVRDLLTARGLTAPLDEALARQPGDVRFTGTTEQYAAVIKELGLPTD